MSFSEQADYSAEQSEGLYYLDQLRIDQAAAGSVAEYVRTLGTNYLASPEHRPNMLQLQRMAKMVTNPNNEPAYSEGWTAAFYWGEVLAYRAQESIRPYGWAKKSYEVFSQNMTTQFFKNRRTPLDAPDSRLHMAAITLGELEMATEETMPDDLDTLALEWADAMIADPAEQSYMLLGFRHVVTQVMKRVNDEQEDQWFVDEYEAIAFENGDPVDGELADEPERESVDDVRDELMLSYKKHKKKLSNVDMDSEIAERDAQEYIGQLMLKDFEKMEGLAAGDLVEFSGGGAFNVETEQRDNRLLRLIHEGEIVRGEIETISLGYMPTLTTLRAIKMGEHTENSPWTPFQPLLALKNAVLVEANGKMTPYLDRQVMVMLAPPKLHMEKYLL